MITSSKYIPSLDINSFIKSFTVQDGLERHSFKNDTNFKKQFHLCRLSAVNCREGFDEPHISDFYTIYFVTKGSLAKINQLESLTLEPQEIFFSKPGEIKTWRKVEGLEGFLLSFTIDYLMMLINDRAIINSFDYLLPDFKRKFTLNKTDYSYYKGVFEELLKEFSTPVEHTDELIRFWIFVLLIKTNRLNLDKDPFSKRKVQKKSSDIIYADFLKLVDRKYAELAKGNLTKPLMVREFAELLNINPTYLGECVRKASGKSAKSILNKRTLLLAKCQLVHTRNNISEIAYQLGFESPGYFIRFFKKFESKTPLEFRNTAYA